MGHVVAGLEVALEIQTVETDDLDLPLEAISITSIAVNEATSEQIDKYKDLTE